jgi:tRNA threonylcarbamoyladenosine biosynthesis protein TsaE
MPILDSNTLEFFSRSAEQTRRLGIRLGGILQRGDAIYLKGDLGAGKTTFVQGIAQGWGSLDPVSSPTFVFANMYRRPDGQVLNHLDAYRLSGPDEAMDLDILIMLEQGALVVEWPERIEAALPKKYLMVEMRWMAEEQRGMVFTGVGERADQLIEEFRRRVLGG